MGTNKSRYLTLLFRRTHNTPPLQYSVTPFAQIEDDDDEDEVTLMRHIAYIQARYPVVSGEYDA